MIYPALRVKTCLSDWRRMAQEPSSFRQNKTWFVYAHDSCNSIVLPFKSVIRVPNRQSGLVCMVLTCVSSNYVCLTAWTRVLQKLTVVHIVRKLSASYGTRRFLTVFIRTCRLGGVLFSVLCHWTQGWRVKTRPR
jgi:hypothetical protein